MEIMTKDVREAKWKKWLALAIALTTILIFMVATAEACTSGPEVRQHIQSTNNMKTYEIRRAESLG